MPSPTNLTRRHFTASLAAALALPRHTFAESTRRTHRFSVFSLFHPQQLTVQSTQPILLHLNQTDHLLAPTNLATSIRLLPNNRLEIILNSKAISTDSLHLTSTSGEAATFTLAVPPPSLHGTITRQYQGTLEVHATAQSLTPIVSIATETAVASIVLAESPPHAPQSFLETQSIVSRSFLLAATTGHIGFDFCDTTHCQFLREPPPPDSPATIATRATHALHLTFEGRPFAAMYSRSCGGRTHTLAQLGLPVASYPYYAVDCPFCRQYPEQWQRPLSATPHTERDRLALNRIQGWSTLPSSTFTQTPTLLEGRGIGHGIGLCQLGAAALATQGQTPRQILAHFYPNTTITA